MLDQSSEIRCCADLECWNTGLRLVELSESETYAPERIMGFGKMGKWFIWKIILTKQEIRVFAKSKHLGIIVWSDRPIQWLQPWPRLLSRYLPGSSAGLRAAFLPSRTSI